MLEMGLDENTEMCLLDGHRVDLPSRNLVPGKFAEVCIFRGRVVAVPRKDTMLDTCLDSGPKLGPRRIHGRGHGRGQGMAGLGRTQRQLEQARLEKSRDLEIEAYIGVNPTNGQPGSRSCYPEQTRLEGSQIPKIEAYRGTKPPVDLVG